MTNKDNNLSSERRSFIKSSAMLAGGLALSNLPFYGVYAAGSGAIKIALVGCGDRGTGAAFQALSTNFNVKLVAMADAFRDRIDKSYEPVFTKFGKEKVDVPED